MELQHLLKRRTVEIAVNKALNEMKNNAERNTRNLLDLGLLFAREPNQKWFFEKARNIMDHPQNSYHTLIKRMIDNIDVDIIKTVGINWGYNSFVYGTKLLRRSEKALGYKIPWLLVFDIAGQNNIFFHKMDKYMNEGQGLGIYTYLFKIYSSATLYEVINMAVKYNECVIIVSLSPELITPESAFLIKGGKNIVVSVKTEETDANRENRAKAFAILRGNNCLFGFHTGYNEETAKCISSISFIRSMINGYCTFGVYISDPSTDKAYRDDLYSLIRSARSGQGQALLLVDWYDDMQLIENWISAGGNYMVVSSNGETRCGNTKRKFTGDVTLTEMIKCIMPGI